MEDHTAKFKPLLHRKNRRSLLLFNSENQAILYDKRFRPPRWTTLDLRIIKTDIKALRRFILLENGELWMIESQQLQKIEVGFEIADFKIVELKIYILTRCDSLFLYHLRNGDFVLLENDVVLLPECSSRFGIMIINTSKGACLHRRFLGDFLSLGIPDVKSYIGQRKFSLLVTVTNQLFLVHQVNTGEITGMFLIVEEIKSCPSHEVNYGDLHLMIYDLTNTTEVRNFSSGTKCEDGIVNHGLIYLFQGQLRMCYFSKRDGITKHKSYPDGVFQDIASITGRCYVRDSQGQIHRCLSFPKLQLLPSDEPIFFRRNTTNRTKSSRR